MVWIIAAIVVLVVLLTLMFRGRRRQVTQVTRKLEPKLAGNDVIEEIDVNQEPELEEPALPELDQPQLTTPESAPSVPEFIALRLIAHQERPYAGYELLQSLLAAGFRFGKMDIFHRHANNSGEGPVLFSLASVAEPGTFDIHNMGACSCPGLTMFMQFAEQENLVRSFNIMLETAQQLIDDLGGVMWDDRHRPLDQMSIRRWQEKIRNYENSKYSYDLFNNN